MKKQVFITGGSRGIGKSIATHFKYLGHEVVSPTRAELDLGNPDAVKNYLAQNPKLSPDILINNAGENVINPISKIQFSDWERILNTNLSSVFLLIQNFAPKMAKKKWGRIINISSCYSIVSRMGRAAYSSSKAGLNGLTRAAALEFGADNILVNSISPGFVETDMTHQNNSEEQIKILSSQTALKRLAQPNEIAELLYFLASEKNTYITGQNIVIDGGFIIQ